MACTLSCSRHLRSILGSNYSKCANLIQSTPHRFFSHHDKSGLFKISGTGNISTVSFLAKPHFLKSTGQKLKPSLFVIVRTFSRTQAKCLPNQHSGGVQDSNKTGLIYIVAVFIFMLGGAYAGVPLYKVFCQATGLGGQAVRGHDTAQVETMKAVDRPIRVIFNADVASSMRWNFRPQQTEVTVRPGETALAFYTAKNPTDKPIIGISTYNVLPYDAGQYFNKIQCFCFEEQRLNPKEEVDMPVFFYIDPEFTEDPKLEAVNNITLSYTFFEARDGLQLPLPGYPQPHDPPQPQQTM